MMRSVVIYLGGFMKNVACLIVLALLPLSVPADDITKIDTVVEQQERSFEKVENDPLQGRKYGVELNPFRLLVSIASQIDKANKDNRAGEYFTGTVSYFSHALNAEIALPFFYSSEQYYYATEKFTKFDGRFTLITIDAHYRRFFGDTLNGIYVSGFGRLARLRGRTGEDFVFYNRKEAQPYATENKFGVGVGIGYRIFLNNAFNLKNKIYWGASLSVGRYLTGKNDKFANNIDGFFYTGPFEEDDQRFIDMELLKLGYAF